MQVEGAKCKMKAQNIFIMNFSVLDFFKFASRTAQIAQVKLVSTFKIVHKGWGVGGGGACPGPPPPPRNFLFFFFISNSRH